MLAWRPSRQPGSRVAGQRLLVRGPDREEVSSQKGGRSRGGGRRWIKTGGISSGGGTGSDRGGRCRCRAGSAPAPDPEISPPPGLPSCSENGGTPLCDLRAEIESPANQRGGCARAHPPMTSAEQTRNRVGRLRRLLILGIPMLALVISAGLLIAGLPDYSRNIAWEQNAMTWVQSVTMMLAAFLASAMLVRTWLAGRSAWVWAVVACGFLALAIDDQFYIHERVRDDLLSGAPRPLPWAPVGDVVLPFGAVRALTIWVIRAMRTDPGARRAFLVGSSVGLIALGADTIDPDPWSDSTLLAEQTVEEIVEFVAQALMVLGLALLVIGREDRYGVSLEERRRRRPHGCGDVASIAFPAIGLPQTAPVGFLFWLSRARRRAIDRVHRHRRRDR